MDIVVTVVGKPGCHLCDDAEEIISVVLKDFPDASLEVVSLDDNPLWGELYGERIPVVLINGVEHGQWRVDPETLRAALRLVDGAALSASPSGPTGEG